MGSQATPPALGAGVRWFESSMPDQENISSNKLRDDILKNNGHLVYRIKWKNPNNNENKEFIKNKIDNFMNFLSCPFSKVW